MWISDVEGGVKIFPMSWLDLHYSHLFNTTSLYETPPFAKLIKAYLWSSDHHINNYCSSRPHFSYKCITGCRCRQETRRISIYILYTNTKILNTPIIANLEGINIVVYWDIIIQSWIPGFVNLEKMPYIFEKNKDEYPVSPGDLAIYCYNGGNSRWCKL